MICFFLIFSHFLMNLKCLFLNKILELSLENIYMSSLVFLIYFFLSKMFVSFKIVFSFSFFFLSTMIYFCFYSFSSLIFLIFFESCVMILIFLIYNFSKEWDKLSSILFMVFLNILGSIPFIYFFWGVYMMESFNFESSSFVSIYYFFCFFLILSSKLPIFYFHFWLTKAHVSANGSSSMVLASLLLKVGGMGFFKYSMFFFKVSNILKEILISFSTFYCFLILFVILRFFDLKYLIACSSISHMSLIFFSFLSLQVSGTFASFLMMLGHGIVSMFLFFLISLTYESNFNRSSDFNKSSNSISKNFSWIFFFFLLLNLGLPPFLNFFSELFFSFTILNVSLFCFHLFFSCLLGSAFMVMKASLKILMGKKNYFNILSPNNNFFSCFLYGMFFLIYFNFFFN